MRAGRDCLGARGRHRSDTQRQAWEALLERGWITTRHRHAGRLSKGRPPMDPRTRMRSLSAAAERWQCGWWGGVMGVPANHPAGAAAPGTTFGRFRSGYVPRRRRPSGAAPPLPHHMRATGLGWLTVTAALVTLSLLIFAGELRGPAVAVTVVDDAVVRWLGSLGLEPAMRVLGAMGSWTTITVLLWGLLLALLILKRFRHFLVVVISWTLQGLIIQYVMGPILARPRPFGVPFDSGWGGWALPSEQMAALVVTLVGILYALVPEGRWRQIGKWVATALVTLVATSRVGLGVESPTDVLVGVALGVTIPLLGFRLITPSEVAPVTYRRGRTAHLDVGGARGQAIRRALRD